MLQHYNMKTISKLLADITDQKLMDQFLTDLLTPGELEDLSSRWLAAQLLYAGLTYREVSAKTGLSTATVTRVGRCLKWSSGYNSVLETKEKNIKKRKEQQNSV